jgi:hypothetical protein
MDGGIDSGDGHAALAVTPGTPGRGGLEVQVTCFGKPKRHTSRYTNSSARVSISGARGAELRRVLAGPRRGDATAHREREFSGAGVGTMRFAFSLPTYCIVRRETSTFARIARCGFEAGASLTRGV